MSYAFHIVYRSIERTLTSEEIEILHKKSEEETVSKFNAVIRYYKLKNLLLKRFFFLGF